MCGSADFQVGKKETDDTAAAFKEAANWTEIDTPVCGFCGVSRKNGSSRNENKRASVGVSIVAVSFSAHVSGRAASLKVCNVSNGLACGTSYWLLLTSGCQDGK